MHNVRYIFATFQEIRWRFFIFDIYILNIQCGNNELYEIKRFFNVSLPFIYFCTNAALQVSMIHIFFDVISRNINICKVQPILICLRTSVLVVTAKCTAERNNRMIS